MSLILNIDTALDTASVCLANKGEVLHLVVNEFPKDHSGWLHPAISELLQKSGYEIRDLSALAVSIGPGSYTGLRVGLSTAKGFCFALNLPLITIGTLQMMAYSVKDENADLLCPVIDARRNEVFTAVYDKNLEPVLPAQSMIAGENSF